MRFFVSRTLAWLADRAVTGPLFAWTWSGEEDVRFSGRLADFRPADGQTVIEMMEGKYLLGGMLVDTRGVSPFAVAAPSQAWFSALHGFGWLRHFGELRDRGQRRFARTLVMDWIGRHGSFDRRIWTPGLTARRVMSWLKAYDLLVEDANADQIRTIERALAGQIQSLKVRARLVPDPVPRLLGAIAQVGAALSSAEEKHLGDHLARLEALLGEQIDADGMHLTRNPRVQIGLLVELVPVSQLLGLRHRQQAEGLVRRVEAMQRALDRLVLPTREPAYVNGSGQMPVDLMLSLAAQGGTRRAASALSGGYGVLVAGTSRLVADGGLVPPLEYSAEAHAGGLGFEFARDNTLVAGNCGPPPAQLREGGQVFRQTSAHCAPTIDDLSAARIGGPLLLADRLRPRERAPLMSLDAAENALEMTSAAYRGRYGLDIRRRLTLLAGGETLVGQDRFLAAGRRALRQGNFSIRFHLAPEADVERLDGEEMIHLLYPSGEEWTFLWEGAAAEIEESVRHSLWYGLNRTRQIVLSGPARPDAEIAWIFTRQSG